MALRQTRSYHPIMSNAQFDPAYHATQPGPPQASLRSSSWLLPLFGAGLAFVGVTAGVAGCSRPAASTEAAKPTYSDQQVVDAKKSVCEAFNNGLRALQTALNKTPDTTTGTYSSVLLNARIAELGVANYIFNTLEANPAAPQDLRDSLTEYASLYQKVIITQLGDGTAVEIDPLDAKLHELTPKLSKSCQ